MSFMKLYLLAQQFKRDQSAMGTLEVMLIIAVVIILFIIFREFIVELIQKLINNAQSDIDKYSRYEE